MASAGHWELTFRYLEISEFEDSVLYGACRGDSILLVQELIKRKPQPAVNFGLLGACCGANTEAAELMLQSGASIDNPCDDLYQAAATFGDSLQMVEWLLEHEQSEKLTEQEIMWRNSQVLQGGCDNGNMALIDFAVRQGVRQCDLNLGLKIACKENQRSMIVLMLTLGAEVQYGLFGACSGGHLKLIEKMITKGAVNLSIGMKEAAEARQFECVKFMYTLLPQNENLPELLKSVYFAAFHDDGRNEETVEILEWLQAKGVETCSCTVSAKEHVIELQNEISKDRQELELRKNKLFDVALQQSYYVVYVCVLGFCLLKRTFFLFFNHL